MRLIAVIGKITTYLHLYIFNLMCHHIEWNDIIGTKHYGSCLGHIFETSEGELKLNES